MDFRLECAHMQKVYRSKELAGVSKLSKHTNIKPIKIDLNLYNSLLSSKEEMVFYTFGILFLIKDNGSEY
jgi:hypothetical protein